MPRRCRMALILLCLVGVFISQGVRGQDLSFSTKEPEEVFMSLYPPEKEVEIRKSLLKFMNEYICERLWATEESTCLEVESVTQTLEKNIKYYLNLIMEEAQKPLRITPPTHNYKMRRCIADIKEQIYDAIEEGEGSFSRCAEISSIIQEHVKIEVQKNREEYRLSINYTLENLEQCLQYSTKHSEVQRIQCIEQMMNQSKNQYKAALDILNESKCMARFTNNVLNCISEVFDNIVAKKSQLREEIDTCVGYSYINPEQQDFELSIVHYISNYTKVYTNLNEYYDKIIGIQFWDLSSWQFNQEHNLEKYNQRIKNNLKPYYDELERIYEENRSKEERKCYSNATEKLNNLTAEAGKDLAECLESTVTQREEGLNIFTNIVKDFNAKLQEAGHVALLKCFGQRPQEIFSPKAIDACADLAMRSIFWELRKTEIKLKSLKNMVSSKEILPNDITCENLRDERLLVDADKILNECERCLYGENGNLYAGMTYPKYFTSIPSTTTESIGHRVNLTDYDLNYSIIDYTIEEENPF